MIPEYNPKNLDRVRKNNDIKDNRDSRDNKHVSDSRNDRNRDIRHETRERDIKHETRDRDIRHETRDNGNYKKNKIIPEIKITCAKDAVSKVEKIVSEYNQEKNTPYLGNVEKKQYLGKKPSFENQESKLPQKQPADYPMNVKMANLPIMPIIHSTPFVPPQMQTQMQKMMNEYMTPFIYKDYNINIGGPNANHGLAQMLYEDLLPSPDVYTSYKTMTERNALYDFIRGSFIKLEEGELVDFSGGKRSLNSRLKLLNLAPYNTNKYDNNPYKALPHGMLLYNSCYPITYSKNGCVECNKNHVTINIRIYDLSLEEFGYLDVNAYNALKDITKKNMTEACRRSIFEKSNTLREKQYYEFIRNEINKNKLCPNFVESYCYFLCVDANFDYSKTGLGANRDIKTNCNKSLILLTESPNNNIYDWASNKSVMEKNIEKQVSTGYKTPEMWNGVLFEMMVSFYMMYLKKFTFVDMKIQNSFYIKDISLITDSKNFFVYVIDEIEYYIPNYGYLLMVDSDNHDIAGKSDTIKIVGEFLGDDETKVYKNIYDNMKNCISHSSFTNTSIVAPNATIINTIIKLNSDISRAGNKGNILKKIIPERFCNYMHNRIGQNLYTSEITYISKVKKNLKKGDLFCIQDKTDGNYKICLCVSSENSNIFYIDNIKEYNEIQLTDNDFVSLTSNLDIKQNKNLNEPYLSNENLIETYYI